jgi:hypothetical protein
VIGEFDRETRTDSILKLTALPHERIEAILLKRGISRDSIPEVKDALAAVEFVMDAQDAVAYSFREPYRIGRFGDGSFPVFYSALEEQTCVAEIAYHFRRQFEEQRSGAFAHDRYYHLIECQFSGKAMVLLGAEGKHPELVSATEDGYPFCQRLAKAATEDDVEAFYTRSARAADGTCVPVFVQTTLTGANTLARYRFYAQGGESLNERFQAPPNSA